MRFEEFGVRVGVSVIASAVLVAASSLSANADTDHPPERIELDYEPMRSATDDPLPPDAEEHRDDNEILRDLVADQIPGYGGHYVDEEQQIVYLLVTDPLPESEQQTAKSVLDSAEENRYADYRLVLEPADHLWATLHDAQLTLRTNRPAAVHRVGIDTSNNVLRVGLDPVGAEDAQREIEAALQEAGIPTTAVEFYESDGISLAPA